MAQAVKYRVEAARAAAQASILQRVSLMLLPVEKQRGFCALLKRWPGLLLQSWQLLLRATRATL